MLRKSLLFAISSGVAVCTLATSIGVSVHISNSQQNEITQVIPPNTENPTNNQEPQYKYPVVDVNGVKVQVENLESSLPQERNVPEFNKQASRITVNAAYNKEADTLTISVNGNGKEIENLQKIFYLANGSIANTTLIGSTFTHNSLVIHNPDKSLFNGKSIIVYVRLMKDNNTGYGRINNISNTINI